jgi:hypothetical protein
MAFGQFFRSATAVGAFPVLLLLHSAAFYLLPFPLTLAMALVVALVGFVATSAVVSRIVVQRNRFALILTALVASTWVAWLVFPTRDLGITARFHLEKHKYEEAIAQTPGGAQPACVASRTCMSDGYTPPYLVFPYEGFLNAFVGIVHVPEQDQLPRPERMAVFAAGSACDSRPLASQYYVCHFY